MTRRDLAWRATGTALFALACLGGVAGLAGATGKVGLPGFVLALIGLVLIVRGRRIADALRIERGRHRLLAQAIHARRRRGEG